MLSLFSELLFELLSCFTELLSKYALKGQKSSLVGIKRLLSCLDGLLVDSRRSINRGSVNSSSSSRLNSLRRLRFLDLFLDNLLSWSGLFGSLLPGWTKWLIMIGHWKFVWLRSLGLLLILLLYDDSGLLSRRGSTKVDRLVNHVAYCSTQFTHSFI